MQRVAPLLLGLTVLTCGVSLAAPAAAATNAGIKVYTWTDANGTTHFSDVPRHNGPTRQLILPTPAPANQTLLAADRAWVRREDRLAQARQAREAARERAEQEREAMEAERRQAGNEAQVGYAPLYLAYGYHRHRGHHHDHDDRRHPHDHRPSAAFPSNALPSSFPNPMASSFPPGLPSSFPESPSSPPHH